MPNAAHSMTSILEDLVVVPFGEGSLQALGFKEKDWTPTFTGVERIVYGSVFGLGSDVIFSGDDRRIIPTQCPEQGVYKVRAGACLFRPGNRLVEGDGVLNLLYFGR